MTTSNRRFRPSPAGLPRGATARRLALLVLAVVGLGCRAGEPVAPAPAASVAAPATKAAEDAPMTASADTVPLTVHPAGGPAVALRVELAVTPEDRARGLMFRKALAPATGMLFVFAREGRYPFYMRNTYVALDIVYLDAEGRVLGALERMHPLDETPRVVEAPARYVLEVEAGSVERWGLRPGDAVDLPPLPTVRDESW